MVFSSRGNQREGKTLLMTALALYMAKLLGNIPIVANYHITGYDNFYFFEKPDDLIDPKTKRMRCPNVILLWDELGASTDSRTWGSKQQIMFTHLFSQFGKQGINFIYSCQRENLVEKRIREQTDIVIECTKNIFNGRMFEDWYNTQRGIMRPKKIGSYEVIGAQMYWNNYDTFEAVNTNARFDDIVGK